LPLWFLFFLSHPALLYSPSRYCSNTLLLLTLSFFFSSLRLLV
jgi:hypothetical protein